MPAIRILAVEDDPIISESLVLLVEEMGYELIEVVDNGPEALRLHKAARPDLVLMDIMIKGTMDGIQVANRMNETLPTPIIFITSITHGDTFKKAKKALPLAYVTKPFNDVSLQYAIELAISRIHENAEAPAWRNDVMSTQSFFIKVENKLVKVLFDEIDWIEVEGKLVTIVAGNTRHQVKMALKDIEDKLPPAQFLRVHRKYLININKLEQVDMEEHVLYINDQQLPLGNSYKEPVMQKLNLLN